MKTQQEFEAYLDNYMISRFGATTGNGYVRQAFIDGYTACQEEIKWISVKDRLPDEYCQCLIYCPISFPKNSRVLAANYYPDDETFICDADEVIHEDTTHWMPLPQKPLNQQP